MGSGEDNEPIPKDRGPLRKQWIYLPREITIMVDFDLNLGDLRRKILNADLEQRTISPGVAVLEKMAAPLVTTVKTNRIPC